MPFEDDLSDHEDKAPPPQELPVASLASTSAPPNALHLVEGRTGFASALDVPPSMVDAMRDILHEPMKIHFQGTQKYTTPNKRQMQKFIAACFDDGQWKTGDYNNLPSPKDIAATVGNVCITIGTLTTDMGAVSRERANNMPTRKDITHRVVNRGENTKVTKNPPEKQKISRHRQAGSKVLLGVVKGADNSFTFKYYDGAHRVLPSSSLPMNLAPSLGTIERAKLACMKQYETWWMKHGLQYNMEVARYIARNRLTFYANGGQLDLNKIPEDDEELMESFVHYKLIRNMDAPSSVADQIDQVKAIPLPDLFSCF